MQRLFKRDGRGVEILRDAGAFRLVLAFRLAELHEGAEAAGARGDHQAALRIGAEFAHAVVAGCLRVAFGRADLAGVAAVGIIRATDEGTELADLQAEASAVA